MCASFRLFRCTLCKSRWKSNDQKKNAKHWIEKKKYFGCKLIFVQIHFVFHWLICVSSIGGARPTYYQLAFAYNYFILKTMWTECKCLNNVLNTAQDIIFSLRSLYLFFFLSLSLFQYFEIAERKRQTETNRWKEGDIKIEWNKSNNLNIQTHEVPFQSFFSFSFSKKKSILIIIIFWKNI